MPGEEAYLLTMEKARDSLPPHDPLRDILVELLDLARSGRVFFNEVQATANATPLYRPGPTAPAPPAPPRPEDYQSWGAVVFFKKGNLPNFVHELTHACCIVSYKAEATNYLSGHGNRLALQLRDHAPAIAGVPDDARMASNAEQRMIGWIDQDAAVFLDTNLVNLAQWVDVTNHRAAAAWLDKAFVKQLDGLEKKKKKSVDEQKKLDALRQKIEQRGLLVPKSGKSEKDRQLVAEADRRKAFLHDRIVYGRQMIHVEYDTVVNQMLMQMFLWGLRPLEDPVYERWQLLERVRDRSIPAQYLYNLVLTLAAEAYRRRTSARLGRADRARITVGHAPAVRAPEHLIGPLPPPPH
jgi:hypothetical protein